LSRPLASKSKSTKSRCRVFGRQKVAVDFLSSATFCRHHGRQKVDGDFLSTSKVKKADIALPQSYGTSLVIWDHTVLLATRHNPALTRARQDSTRFTYPGEMVGWVDLVDLIAPRPGVELATFRSRVRRPTTAPPRQLFDFDGDVDETLENRFYVIKRVLHLWRDVPWLLQEDRTIRPQWVPLTSQWRQ